MHFKFQTARIPILAYSVNKCKNAFTPSHGTNHTHDAQTCVHMCRAYGAIKIPFETFRELHTQTPTMLIPIFTSELNEICIVICFHLEIWTLMQATQTRIHHAV